MVTAEQIADLRNRKVRLPPLDLRPYFFRARNQNPFSACAAFALASVQEYYLFRKEGKIDKKQLSSPAFLWHEFRHTSCTVDEHKNPDGSGRKNRNEGSSFPEFLDIILAKGCCSEDAYPYDTSTVKFEGFTDHYDNKITKKPSASAYSEAESRKIFGSYELLGDDVNRWIAELFNGNPLLIGISKYPSAFESPGLGPFMADADPENGRGHGMVIVGYIPDHMGYEFFIVRNSYGEHWKDKGYCYFSFDCLKRCLGNPVVKMVPNFTPVAMPGIPKLPSVPPAPKSSPRGPPAPTHAPAPAPSSIPPYTPTPRKGDFAYQWWLFDTKEQVKDVVQRGLGTHTLQTSGIGQSLDTDPRRMFIDCDTSKFTNINTIIADPANAGKIIGLGACRRAEVTGDPARADGKWKWDFRHIKGKVKPEAEVFLQEKGVLVGRGKGRELHVIQPGYGSESFDSNFVIIKNAATIHVKIGLYKKREDSDRLPDPDDRNEKLLSYRDWNIQYRFGGKGTSQNPVDVTVEKIELKPGKMSDLLLFFKSPQNAESGMYYMLVQAYHETTLLDYNYIEFEMVPPPPRPV
jgi:hypothetical protein